MYWWRKKSNCSFEAFQSAGTTVTRLLAALLSRLWRWVVQEFGCLWTALHTGSHPLKCNSRPWDSPCYVESRRKIRNEINKMCNDIAVCCLTGTASAGTRISFIKSSMLCNNICYISFFFHFLSVFSKTSEMGRQLPELFTHLLLFLLDMFVRILKIKTKVPAKRQQIFTRLHGLVLQRTWIVSLWRFGLVSSETRRRVVWQIQCQKVVKVKFALEEAMAAKRGSRDIVVLFL